jgi:glycosyltransferase involved in cell wall biosynthesis
MNIILFAHPTFMQSQSMPRFAKMLEQAYLELGHQVQVWSPQPHFYKRFSYKKFSKWAGYIDQYILFPLWVRAQLKHQLEDAIFVFADQALGPWVPLVKNRPHVVHAHDLLALRSALGEIPENPTSWSGRLYQRYIRHGFKQAKHFISVSKKTRDDLLIVGQVNPMTSEVVYNALNYTYKPMPVVDAKPLLAKAGLPIIENGFLLHLGGSQWYKNLAGVMHIYTAYAKMTPQALPLVCVSPKPNDKIEKLIKSMPANAKVIFIQGIDNPTLQAAYSMAAAFIFPSLAEGFGWPIAEAQACGCPVLTSDAAPMNEVGGKVATYIPVLKLSDDCQDWARNSAEKLITLITMTPEARKSYAKISTDNISKFDSKKTIDEYLSIYSQVLACYNNLAQSNSILQRAHK